MSNKYWQSFGELKGSEELAKKSENEFQEELPFEDRNGKGWLDATAPRRDFLKYLGFSTAAAAIAAGCKTHIRKAVPFANKPADVIPGVSKYYATTYVQDGDVLPILAKVRDGRPIKIEGNPDSYTMGGTSARVQASVLDLYDMNRLTHPKRKAGDKFEEVPTFEQLDKMVAAAMTGSAKTYLLTSTITSPTTKDIIAKYPNITHVQYDADSFNGMLLANEATFGKKAIPSYDFSKAKVIVSLGADFLGTWLNPVEFARQYAQTRKLKDGATEMSKHIQFESYLSTTGANADERFTHRPSEAGAVASALLAGLNGNAATSAVSDSAKAGIAKTVAALNANKGAALVVSGSNDVNVQIIVNAINNAIGAYGNIIDWSTTLNFRQGTDAEFESMLSDLSGNTILIYGANPAYNYHDPKKFASALAKAKTRVSFNEYLDETTQLCDFVIPSHHFLESWGDAEPKPGYISFIQPTIHPLFKTRAFQTSLLKWSGNNTDYETYFKNYWEGKLGSKLAFDAVLEKGVIDPKGSPVPVVTTTPVVTDTVNKKPVAQVPTVQKPVSTGSAGSFNNAAVEKATADISGAKKGGAVELVLYQKVSIGTGKQGTNPWLQELPDPITKATWDNYVLMSMPKAKEIVGIDLINGSERHINNYEYFPEKPIVSISVNGKDAFELPVLVVPGMDANTIAIAVGYGRTDKLGLAAGNIGANVYPFSSSNGTTRDYFSSNVTIKDTGKKYRIAQSQVHNSYENRTEVVKETSLATFNKDRKQFKKFREELAADFAPKTGDFRKEATIYPDHLQPGLKWGMSIDMNSCVACGACVVACHAENNVPVVGRAEVARYHDMHWLRIDRYYVSDEKNPDNLKAVVFQPMMCQHCDNAPCENVCPVAATNHSSEGINQMAYNRCIGTRYCANNCPYKVRRFNWADYTGADSFPDNRDNKLVGKLDPVVEQMNDDLTRMVLNPDVTVRSRGVMEKCSFCIQRTQEAKLTAKKQGVVLEDGKAVTACMQACPTNAIVFGNVKDKNSQIAKTRAENDDRLFYVIEQIHTLPNVNYLAKIRNTDEILEMKHHEEVKEGSVETNKTEAAH